MSSIAVIDSGIDINFKEFKNKKIKALNINTYETSIESIKDFNGHGTACASEILRINPNADINIIKLLDENSQSTVKKLIESIEYASSIDDVRLISLSCSTFQDKYLNDFKNVIEYANRKNKLVICSSDNENKLSYPSYMDGVIGVKRCNTYIEKYWFNKNRNIQCVCESKYRLLPNINKNYKLFGGNSYCAAYFCGLVSMFIKGDCEIENKMLIDIINKNADKNIWSVNCMDVDKYLGMETINKKYDYYKFRILLDSIGEFSNINIEDIGMYPIYNIVGIHNVYKFLKYLENKINQSIKYIEITAYDLRSIYSLYNLIFKDDIK
ncbi:S8 family serine peptidase [Romboutsia weinsteinii]|uniref:S8 family serine peptidase n=1 Tax=Romboutsia weinsteinii TaxID=2020949 RepID=UPI0013141A81|nr:S8 family serine peptidase [Romboutsia weinsteinii]